MFRCQQFMRTRPRLWVLFACMHKGVEQILLHCCSIEITQTPDTIAPNKVTERRQFEHILFMCECAYEYENQSRTGRGRGRNRNEI